MPGMQDPECIDHALIDHVQVSNRDQLPSLFHLLAEEATTQTESSSSPAPGTSRIEPEAEAVISASSSSVPQMSSSVLDSCEITPTDFRVEHKTQATDSNIECRVCEDVFTVEGDNVPRLLHCGHTVCHQCLSRLPLTGSDLLCPFDRQATPIGDAGIGSLKKNFALIEVLPFQHFKNLLERLEKEPICMPAPGLSSLRPALRRVEIFQPEEIKIAHLVQRLVGQMTQNAEAARINPRPAVINIRCAAQRRWCLFFVIDLIVIYTYVGLRFGLGCPSRFTGAFCNQCLPRFTDTGAKCTQCIPPFTGTNCQSVPSGFLALKPFASSAYVISTFDRTWSSSRSTCHNLGGDLVAMETDDEWHHIHDEVYRLPDT